MMMSDWLKPNPPHITDPLDAIIDENLKYNETKIFRSYSSQLFYVLKCT